MRGVRLMAPKDLPVRPTTDMAKESLFNILGARFDWEESSCLDLFSGTGNIALELSSRGSHKVLAVDRHLKCCKYIDMVKEKYRLTSLEVLQSDVFKYLETCKEKFDLIFADPPYDMPNLYRIPELVFNQQLLLPEGMLVLEHSSMVQLDQAPFYQESRIYGSSAFSFFSNPAPL